ncbi:MAG: hypothetical protein JXA94_07695 [Parachlamydiales bacterium]|nr:hypothetical protein [Parachlamydiales bacterium]
MAARSRDLTAKPPPPLCLGSEYAHSEEELVAILLQAHKTEYRRVLELIEQFKKLYETWIEEKPNISPPYSPLAPSTPLTPGEGIEKARACAEEAMEAFAQDHEQALTLMRKANQLLERVSLEKV